MYKLAAVTAVAAAANIEEFQQTAELFKIKLHQQEVEGLEAHAQALQHESMKFNPKKGPPPKDLDEYEEM